MLLKYVPNVIKLTMGSVFYFSLEPLRIKVITAILPAAANCLMYISNR